MGSVSFFSFEYLKTLWACIYFFKNSIIFIVLIIKPYFYVLKLKNMSKIKKTKNEPTPKAVAGKEVEEDVICVYKSEIVRFLRFGRELKITPKANCTVNKPGFKIEFFVPAVNVLIGIGNDHVANLVMDLHAWEALVKGAEVHITTTKEFNEDSVDKLIKTKTK